MAGGVCPGSCNSRWREAQQAYQQAMALYDPLDKDQSRPEPPDIRPWEGEPYWCGPCSSRILQRLHQLDDAICILLAFADGLRDAPDAPLVGGTPDAMSPSAAADMADDLYQMLVGWEDAYRKCEQWAASMHDGSLARQTTECSSWLMAHLRDILASPVAEDIGREILDWHREIVSRAKAGTRKLRKPMRCPGCQQLTLTWVEGDEDVNCSDPSCRVVMAYGEYMNEVERRAGGAAA